MITESVTAYYQSRKSSMMRSTTTVAEMAEAELEVLSPCTPEHTVQTQDQTSGPFYSYVDTATRKLHEDFMKKVRQPLGFKDCKEGMVYAAHSLSTNRSMVKVGFSEYYDDSRIDAITNECGEAVEQTFKTNFFVGAHRVEQIFHTYLRPINYHRYDCKCGHVNTEWYDAGYEWLVGLVLVMEKWMAEQNPYKVDDEKRLKFLEEWKKIDSQEPKLEQDLKLKEQDLLLAKYKFELCKTWDTALVKWFYSQLTRNPMTLHEFFTKGTKARNDAPLPSTPSVQRLVGRHVQRHGLQLSLFDRRHSTPPTSTRIHRPAVSHSASDSIVQQTQSDGSTLDFENLDRSDNIRNEAVEFVRPKADQKDPEAGFRLTRLLQHYLSSVLIPLEERVIMGVSEFWSQFTFVDGEHSVTTTVPPLGEITTERTYLPATVIEDDFTMNTMLSIMESFSVDDEAQQMPGGWIEKPEIDTLLSSQSKVHVASIPGDTRGEGPDSNDPTFEITSNVFRFHRASIGSNIDPISGHSHSGISTTDSSPHRSFSFQHKTEEVEGGDHSLATSSYSPNKDQVFGTESKNPPQFSMLLTPETTPARKVNRVGRDRTPTSLSQEQSVESSSSEDPSRDRFPPTPSTPTPSLPKPANAQRLPRRRNLTPKSPSASKRRSSGQASARAPSPFEHNIGVQVGHPQSP